MGNFPGGPSPCPGHYNGAFDYYAASALCPARSHSRVLFRSSSLRVPQFYVNVFSQPVAARYTPGVWWENPHGCVSHEAQPLHLLVKCVSRFHLSLVTTLQTRVPLGSLGRRGSPCLRFGSKTSVHCRWASHLETCYISTHATSPSHRSPDGPLQATRLPIKGRTT